MGGVINENVPGFIRWLTTPAGRVPVISTSLRFRDTLGAWKSRWNIGRMSYIVPPGLYAVGTPGNEDPVIVTANYKMTYDIVRSILSGRNVWILVLETNGINVWCAAGKGTFGTEELIRQVQAADLGRIVTHRNLILPILGAPGVAAHIVKSRTGFTVQYGTARASDIPQYLDNGMRTEPHMHELTFTLRERIVLIPVELMLALRSIMTAAVLLTIAAAFIMRTGSFVVFLPAIAYAGAVVAGIALVPVLLPFVPGKSFAVKGAILGLLWALVFYFFAGGGNWLWHVKVLNFLAAPVVSAFYGLNFTGCTPFTSRSGVKKELRISMPLMIGSLALAAICFIIGTFTV